MDTRLENLKRALESAVEDMSSEQMSWHPAGKWCAAEVLEHLYLTYTGTIKGFERMREAGKPTSSQPSMKQRWRGLVIFGFRYFPSGRKSPVVAEPRGLAPETVRMGVGAKIEAMDAIIGRCEAAFGNRIALLDHPILGPLTAGQWKDFHLVHGMHHRKQLQRLREGSAKI